MSTRSIIITETETGYAGIYCHFDGYILGGVGQMLLENYTDPIKVRRLIDLGYISSLEERLEPVGSHDFSEREEGTTVAYMRDRGDKDLEAFHADTLQEVKDHFARAHNGYVYVYEDGLWTVNGTDLETVFQKEMDGN